MATVVEVINLDKKAKKAISNKKYYEKNKEKIKSIVKEWVSLNKDTEEYKNRTRNSSKSRYDNNPEYREQKKAKMREYMKMRTQQQLIAV